MSKRLTDSAKWNHPWFRKLPGNFKLAFFAILDLCDCAGIYRVDLEDLEYRMNLGRTDWEGFIDKMGGRIIPLPGGEKWQIRDYVAFQYGRLNPNGKGGVHTSVIKCLRSHGIDPAPYFSPTLEATVDATVGPTLGPTAKEKEKVKEKVQDKDSNAEPDPASVFTGAPKPVPSSQVKLGPHEIRSPLIAAGAKIYGAADAEGWLGVIRRSGGLDRVVYFMGMMPAEDRAERVKVETFIQKADRSRQKARRLDEAGEQARDADSERKSREQAIKAANEEAREPTLRVVEYLGAPETPENLKDRMTLDTVVISVLKLSREGKFSAVSLGHILRKFPEVRPVAYPQVEQSA